MNRQQIFLYTFLGSQKSQILVEKRFNFRFVSDIFFGHFLFCFSWFLVSFFKLSPIRINPLLSRLMAVFYIRLRLFCFSMVFSMVFTRYKMPAMPLTINLDATSKTATFFATFVLIATYC